MKERLLLFLSVFYILINLQSQGTYQITFIGEDMEGIVELDSIKIMNLTLECDTTLYWPQTIIDLTFPVGIPEPNNVTDSFRLFQNYPNPVNEQTSVRIFVPEKDNLEVSITDLSGRVILNDIREVEKGYQIFTFTPENSLLYFLSSIWRDQINSIKIINLNTSGKKRKFF